MICYTCQKDDMRWVYKCTDGEYRCGPCKAKTLARFVQPHIIIENDFKLGESKC